MMGDTAALGSASRDWCRVGEPADARGVERRGAALGASRADAAQQLDIMGSVMITDPAAPGGVTEAKLISGIDDHSRYSVIGKVVPRSSECSGGVHRVYRRDDRVRSA